MDWDREPLSTTSKGLIGCRRSAPKSTRGWPISITAAWTVDIRVCWSAAPAICIPQQRRNSRDVCRIRSSTWRWMNSRSTCAPVSLCRGRPIFSFPARPRFPPPGVIAYGTIARRRSVTIHRSPGTFILSAAAILTPTWISFFAMAAESISSVFLKVPIITMHCLNIDEPRRRTCARFGWTGSGWDLAQADGTHMFFPESYNAKRGVDGALIGLTSPKGEPLKFQRGRGRNLEAVSTTNGQLKFDYDSRNRLRKAHDSRGRTIHYTYDLAGRLVQVQKANSMRRYAYDGTYLMSVHENEQRLYRLQYTRGRASELLLTNGQSYKFRYDYDPADNYTVIRSYVVGPDRAVKKFDIDPE
jgi:YD repeat-containing protein